MKEKIIVAYKYKKPGLAVLPNYLPTFRHLPTGCSVVAASMMEAGKIERDGEQYEFQTIRILIEVK